MRSPLARSGLRRTRADAGAREVSVARRAARSVAPAAFSARSDTAFGDSIMVVGGFGADAAARSARTGADVRIPPVALRLPAAAIATPAARSWRIRGRCVFRRVERIHPRIAPVRRHPDRHTGARDALSGEGEVRSVAAAVDSGAARAPAGGKIRTPSRRYARLRGAGRFLPARAFAGGLDQIAGSSAPAAGAGQSECPAC